MEFSFLLMARKKEYILSGALFLTSYQFPNHVKKSINLNKSLKFGTHGEADYTEFITDHQIVFSY